MRRRRIKIGAAVVAAIVAGVASASAVMPTSDTALLDGPAAVQPDGTGATIAAKVADPFGGRDLAVRVYRSQTGKICPEAARFDGNNFGQEDAAGDFRSNDVQAAGSCVDLDRESVGFAINRYAKTDGHPAFAVVFGVVAPRVSSLTLTLAGSVRPVRVTEGAYVVPLRDDQLADGNELRAVLSDGTVQTFSLAPHAPDQSTKQP